MAVSTPVDAERAWTDLQRVRVLQERVYDEAERKASGAPRAAYATAALMWAFLVSLGLEPPWWGVWLGAAVYVALLGTLGVIDSRVGRMRLHRSRCDWRMSATFVVGGVVTGGTALLAEVLAESLEPVTAALIQATASAAAFLLFIGPASRWAVRAARTHGARATRAETSR
ncbi:hypothetical protein ACFVIM_19950 [Streptomyces sp. NPDC057638]|uniref:hypothetical protein n=1 Tax=Streptomyces sp. NPDC057638 TaxID=3346190 RepID=UPI00368BA24F